MNETELRMTFKNKVSLVNGFTLCIKLTFVVYIIINVNRCKFSSNALSNSIYVKCCKCCS